MTMTADDAEAIRALHRRWILEGWEREAGDPPFRFQDKLGGFYDWEGKGVVLYDTMAPGHRVARGPAEYAALFEPLFNRMRSARHAVADGPDVVVGGRPCRLDARVRGPAPARGRRPRHGRPRPVEPRVAPRREGLAHRPGAQLDPRGAGRGGRRPSGPRLTPPPRKETCHDRSSLIFPAVAMTAALAASGAQAQGADATGEDRNRQVIAEAFDRWAAGGTGFFEEVLAPDVAWTIVGSGPTAGLYQGRDDLLDHAVEPFARRLAEPVRPTEVQGVWADGDHVIARWDGAGTALDGQPYANSYAWIFRMEDGVAVEVTAFLDLVPFDDVLARIPEPG